MKSVLKESRSIYNNNIPHNFVCTIPGLNHQLSRAPWDFHKISFRFVARGFVSRGSPHEGLLILS